MTRAEKRAANRAAHVNKGAHNRGGTPASGIPAQGSAGNWASGPANGPGKDRWRPLGDEYSDAWRALARDPRHREAKAQLRELVLKTWVRVAQFSENDTAAVAAADKLAKRIGLPEEPTVNVNLNRDDLGSLTDEQLDAELARLRRAFGEGTGSGDPAGEGEAPAGEPAGGVPPV